MSERLREFCTNEADRVRRFAAKLDEHGQVGRAAELRELAARLEAMAKDAGR